MVNVVPYCVVREWVNFAHSSSAIRAEHRKLLIDELVQSVADVATLGFGLSMTGALCGPVIVYTVGSVASAFGLLTLPSLTPLGGAHTVGALAAVGLIVVPRILTAVARVLHELHWVMQPEHMQALKLQKRVNWLTAATVVLTSGGCLVVAAYS